MFSLRLEPDPFPEPRTHCALVPASYRSQALSVSVLLACNRVRASQAENSTPPPDSNRKP